MNAQMETLLLSIIKIDKVIVGILLLQSTILEIVICRSALSLSQRVHVAWPVQGLQSPNRQGGQLANNESRRPTARTSIPTASSGKPDPLYGRHVPSSANITFGPAGPQLEQGFQLPTRHAPSALGRSRSRAAAGSVRKASSSPVPARVVLHPAAARPRVLDSRL